jgi:hypothetical protein
MKYLIAASLLTFSLPALAEPPTYTDEEAVSQPVAEQPEGTVQRPFYSRPRQVLPPLTSRVPLKPRYFGIHAAIPGTFAVDLQVGHFYAYLSAGVGVALFSNFEFAGATVGAGYTLPIRKTRRGEWKMDFLGIIGAGRELASNGLFYGFYGGGVGLGFRYEDASGFTLGFKVPIFGYEAGNHIRNTRQGLGLWYLNAAASVPLASVGYRF